MGGLAVTMFVGITALALVTDVHMAEDPADLVGLPPGEAQRTALSQIGLAVFGGGPALISARSIPVENSRLVGTEYPSICPRYRVTRLCDFCWAVSEFSPHIRCR